MTERERGTVKWFDTKKGYGFVAPVAGGKDVFIHINNLPEGIESLRDGQGITFITEQTKKGIRATNVLVED